jgi:tetratricopeptide (TPR) repeat protein
LADSTYRYDVFISYSTQDKAWVRGELLQTLENAGLTVCIDFRDFRVGAPTVTEISELLKASKKTLVVLTPSYIERDWTEFETLLLQTKDPTNKNLRLIPIRKEICEIPENVGILTYVDFAEPDDIEFAWTRLLTALGRPPQPQPAPETPAQWFLAHPYGMPPNFTGRKAELQTLSNWLQNDTQHPLFVLRALGGFGKSALTWHWLTHYVDDQQWPQVMWWSFYEELANFNNFLRLTLAYLTGLDPDAMPPRQQLDTLLRYLERNQVLIVMDGFERELRAYSGMGAAYQGDEIPEGIPQTPLGKGGREGAGALPGGGGERADPGDATSLLPKGGFTKPPSTENLRGDPSRDCINPLAETFVRGLASLPRLQGKVLMSTRLRPCAVELHGGTLLAGCYETELTAMQPEDAVEFFRRQGIAGNRGEIEQACRNYGFHPLSLRLLAGYIAQDFEYPGDIRAAASLDVTGDLVQRRNHVLERSYNNLPETGRRLLGQIACFRSPVKLMVLEAIEQGGAEAADNAETLRRAHSAAMPLRAHLHDLINRGLLQQDTRTTRQGQRIALFDLHPIVRRYAYGRMANADRTTAHGQLRDYFAAVPDPEKVTTLDDLTPVIELYHHMVQAGQYDEARELFSDRIHDVAYYQLGAYQLQIELLRALFPQGEDQPPQLTDEGDQSWTLNSLANSYGLSGQLGAAVPLLELGAGIDERRGDKENHAIVLSNLAQHQLPNGALQAAEVNLRRSIALCREIEGEFWEAVGHAGLGRLLVYRGVWVEAEGELSTACDWFEKNKEVQYLGVTWADRSQAALLQARSGETQSAATALAAATRTLELTDECARTDYPYERDYVRAHWLLGAAHRINGNLAQSETHLSDALTRCRSINLVEAEADILLDLARLHADQGQPAEAQRLAQEALTITERSGYALQGADVRLFLAQQALEAGDHPQALAHAQIARQIATCDGGDYIYRVAYDEAGALLTQLSP